MMTSKQTVLIIGGGWHPPKSYNKLVTSLETSGFDVHVPRHPSLNGIRPPNAGLSTDSTHIRSYVEDLLKNGREVIVLMHSYGGQVGTNSLHGLGLKDRAKSGLKGGVSNLIYMTACALSEGKAMIEMVKHHGHEELMPLAFDIAEDMSCVNRDPKTLLIGVDSGLPEQEVEDQISTLVRWNAGCMYEPLTTDRAAWRDIPVTYIYTTKDMTVPIFYQTWLVEGMKKEGVQVQTATLETGHSPNLTAADEVTEIVAKVARGEVLETRSLEEVTDNQELRDTILSVSGGK